MHRNYAKRLIAGTLAFSCALGGLYIGSARMARAAAATSLQAGGVQQEAGTAAIGAPHKERGGQTGTKRQEAETPPIVSEAAAVLGMNTAALTEQLKAGKSIADVAKERGMSEQQLTAKLLQLRVARIDDAVKNGKMDAARAEQMKQRMGSHLGYMIKEKNLLNHDAFRKSHGWKPSHEQLASVLGLSEEELREQLKAGKSVADIAAAKGMSREKLLAELKEQLTPQLERWVDRKHPAAGEK